MNEAKSQLDAGNLHEAVRLALESVKAKPTDVTARTFLFELSCFSGDWERAVKQLDVIGQQDVNAMIGAQIFKQNFMAERDRIKYFEDGLMPECLIEPPKYVEKLLVANNYVREGNIADARKVLDEVEEERPAFECSVNGQKVSDFRDYNDLTMCVFEAIVKESYAWLPFEHVTRIEFIPPKSLRDLYWLQTEVTMVNGTKGEMFLPALYSGSSKSENDQVRLGRMTDWRELGEDLYLGEGTKMFWFDGEHRSILDLKDIEFFHKED